MTLGDKIRTLRKEKSMTQTELATILHTTKQTIGKYETGIVSNLPLDRVQELAIALDTTPSYLMGWTEEKEKTSALDDQRQKLIDSVSTMSDEDVAVLLSLIDRLKKHD